MSKTDQWEQLLQGTTAGPWEALREDDTPVWTIGRLGDNPARIVGDVYGEGNSSMIAAAPEAVAEVIRLRRMLEALKRKTGSLILSAELLAGDHPFLSGALNGAANEFREIHDTITRILEGES